MPIHPQPPRAPRRRVTISQAPLGVGVTSRRYGPPHARGDLKRGELSVDGIELMHGMTLDQAPRRARPDSSAAAHNRGARCVVVVDRQRAADEEQRGKSEKSAASCPTGSISRSLRPLVLAVTEARAP